MRKVGSNARPEQVEMLQGKTLVNFAIVEVTKDVDGESETSYEYYQKGIQVDAPEELIEQTVIEGEELVSRMRKTKAIEEIVVETKGVEYDAKTRSRADLTGVVALANYTFILAMVEAMPELKPVYDAVYKTTTGWKGADNSVHVVMYEDIAETAKKAMVAYAETIGAN